MNEEKLDTTNESKMTDLDASKKDSVESGNTVTPNKDRFEHSKPRKRAKKLKKVNQVTPEKITKPEESKLVIAVRGLFTKILILTNVAIFIYMVKQYGFTVLTQPNAEILLKMGADYGPYVANGEKWRLVSSMFVHIGIIHLILNMMALSDVGKTVERLYGSQKFLIIYFISGIAGSLTSLLWHPTCGGAGASGAIFGVIGAQFIYVWVHRKYFTAAAIHSHYGMFAMLMAYSLIAVFLNIPLDHAAHVGGFAFGILAGFALVPRVMSNVRWQMEDIPRFAVLLLGLAGMANITSQQLAKIPPSKSSVIIHTHHKQHKHLPKVSEENKEP